MAVMDRRYYDDNNNMVPSRALDSKCIFVMKKGAYITAPPPPPPRDTRPSMRKTTQSTAEWNSRWRRRRL